MAKVVGECWEPASEAAFSVEVSLCSSVLSGEASEPRATSVSTKDVSDGLKPCTSKDEGVGDGGACGSQGWLH